MNIGTAVAPTYVDIGTRLAPIDGANFTGTVNFASLPTVTGKTIATTDQLPTVPTVAGVYAPLASPSFTGTANFASLPTVTGKTIATIDQLPSVPTVSGVYAPLASPSFTGTANFASLPTVTGKTIATTDQIPTVSGVYAPLASPSFTGTANFASLPTVTGKTIATTDIIPSLTGYATTTWVAEQGYSTSSGIGAGTATTFTAKQTFGGTGIPKTSLPYGEYMMPIMNQGGGSGYLGPLSIDNNTLNSNKYCAEFMYNTLVRGSMIYVSDQRSKTNITNIDPLASIAIIDQLVPTNFNYIHGREYCTGFIAQEVKEVLPEAVNLTTDFIPNIYRLGHVCRLLNTDNYTITFSESIGTLDASLCTIKINNKVNNDIMVILEYQVDETNIVVRLSDCKNTMDEYMLVYGQQVSDFHSLTMNTIFVHAVSAIKQLHTENKQLNAEITSLNDRLFVLEKKICN
jgi:hypothetical protein